MLPFSRKSRLVTIRQLSILGDVETSFWWSDVLPNANQLGLGERCWNLTTSSADVRIKFNMPFFNGSIQNSHHHELLSNVRIIEIQRGRCNGREIISSDIFIFFGSSFSFGPSLEHQIIIHYWAKHVKYILISSKVSRIEAVSE